MERDEYTDRYVNPYTDFGFKKLFGTEMNKELLISFINSLLSDKEQIRDLTYLNTENLGISEADRKAVFDVYCETDSGEKILVEMQRGQQLFFKERSLYYASFPIQQQGKRGDWDYQLKAVYVIAILNFVFDHPRRVLPPRSAVDRQQDPGSVLRQADVHLSGNAQVQQERRRA